MKIVILGANDISNLVVSKFSDEHDITIISNSEEYLEGFKQKDINFVIGDGLNKKVLSKVNIEDTDIFIALTDNDDTNIVASLIVKSVCTNAKTVCFASKNDYVESLNFVKDCDFGTRRIIIDKIIWPKDLLTEKIFRIITTPEAIKVEDFSLGKARLTEYRIKENSKILDVKIKECNFPDETLIVGIKRGDSLFIPNGETKLELNDKVIFMGKPKSLDILAWNFFEDVKNIQTATIIGGGDVGLMLAKNLEKVNIKTKIIEKDYKQSECLSETLKKTLVLNGDGTDIELLRNENIGESDLLICVTNNDEKNLLCSLLVKQLGNPWVISRVGKELNIPLFEKVGIDVAVSEINTAVNELKYIIESNSGILSTVEMGEGEVIKLEAKKKFENVKIMDLKMPQSAIIAIIERNSKIIIPHGLTLIRKGDGLIIFTKHDKSDEVRRFFE